MFILVTRLIPLCDVYCYQFLNELGFYVLSASSETNLSFLFEEVLLDLQESGEETRSVFGLHLGLQACHQRDATWLFHPGRVSRSPHSTSVFDPASRCHLLRLLQLLRRSQPLCCFSSQLIHCCLQVCGTVPRWDFNMPLNAKVQVVPPFADPRFIPGKCVRTRTAVFLIFHSAWIIEVACLSWLSLTL